MRTTSNKMASVAPTPTSMQVSIEGTSTIGRSSSLPNPKPFNSARPPKRKSSASKQTAASIPSRYQTYFCANIEKKGFNSQAPRFSLGGDASENPGPGKYEPSTNDFETQSSSFSKKGTGGFASKSHRFRYERKQMLGPGSYNPRPVDNRVDFNKTDASSSFKLPTVANQAGNLGLNGKNDSPAPNAYNLSGVHPGKTTTVAAEAVFKSKTKREAVLSVDNPAPCQYTVQDSALHPSVSAYKSVFNSKSNRDPLGKMIKGPGPAYYKPILDEFGDTSKFGPPKQVPYYRQKHYLCISAPAMPLAPLPPLPGPGHYETQDTVLEPHERKLVSAAVFKSTTSRWLGIDRMDEPGPGAYNPLTANKQSYLYNINRKWI